jgi:hypothetical protein
MTYRSSIPLQRWLGERHDAIDTHRDGTFDDR